MGLLHGLRSAGHALIVLAITIIEVVVIGLVAYLVIYLGYNAYRTMRQKTWLQVKAQYPNCAADALRGMEPDSPPGDAGSTSSMEPGEVPVKSLEAQGAASGRLPVVTQSAPQQSHTSTQSKHVNSNNHQSVTTLSVKPANHGAGQQHHSGAPTSVVTHHHHSVTHNGVPQNVVTHHHSVTHNAANTGSHSGTNRVAKK